MLGVPRPEKWSRRDIGFGSAAKVSLAQVRKPIGITRRDADVSPFASDKPPENLHGRRIAKIAFLRLPPCPARY
jgi:hypothetical protein